MAVKLDDFLPHLLVELPGCSDPLAKQALLRAAIEFCQQTLAWDEVQDPRPLVDGLPDYDLEAPTGAAVFVVRDVWLGSAQLGPVTMAELQRVLPAWRTAESSTPAFYNAAIDRSQIRIFPIPRNAGSAQLVLRVAYVPTAAATTLPDFLGGQYLDALCSGTKARLMAMPGQDWSQPALVPFYGQRFADGVLEAQAERLHERVVGTVTARPRSFI